MCASDAGEAFPDTAHEHAELLFPRSVPWDEKHQVMILYGPPGVGKTTLLRQYAALRPGVFLSLDHPRCAGVGKDEIVKHVERFREGEKRVYVDDAHACEDWEGLVHLLSKKGYEVMLTLSSALVGKSHVNQLQAWRVFTLFPLSFAEFLNARKEPPTRRTLKAYARLSGLPETLREPSLAPHILHDYGEYLVHMCGQEAGMQRSTPKLLAHFVFSFNAREVSLQKVYERLRQGIPLAFETLRAFFHCLEERLVVFTLPRWSWHGEKNAYPRKVYALDHGLVTAFTQFEEGRIVELLVFLHLKRLENDAKDFTLAYFRAVREVDFILTLQGETFLIQVTPTAERIPQRKYAGLALARSVLKQGKSILLSLQEEKRVEAVEGMHILHVPLWEFLFNPRGVLKEARNGSRKHVSFFKDT